MTITIIPITTSRRLDGAMLPLEEIQLFRESTLPGFYSLNSQEICETDVKKHQALV